MVTGENFFVSSLHALVAKKKQEEFAEKPIRTLGEVILLLKAQPISNIVKLDFTEEHPRNLISYRGYYEDLCLDYDDTAPPITVGRLLEMFEVADGQTYTGYKGGDFTMHRKTLVWVAPYSMCGRMLTDIKSTKGITTIYTQEDGI